MKSLKIGKLTLKNPLFLAPMLDVTSLPYRLLCRKAGVAMAYTEMLYLDAITHQNVKTMKMMQTCPKDRPLGVQITGGDIEALNKAISMKVFNKYDLVDINCGCPSVRITGNEAGSFLLKNPQKIAKMIKLLKKEGYTVTAKIRLGFDKNEVIKISKIIEKAGADALTIHARLAVHGGNIPADWSQIEKVKRMLKIPVIGNGDVFTGKDAERMLSICDGVMLAIAAIGDPYIFTRILRYLKNKKEEEFNLEKNLEAFNDYLDLCEKYNFEDLKTIKYLGGNFIRNFQGAAKKRTELMKMKTFDEIREFVKKRAV